MILLVACFTSLHADEAVPTPEMQKAFIDFSSFLNQSFTKATASGIFPTVLAESSLPEARKRCAVLVAAAKDRNDIASAATLTLDAFSYLVSNIEIGREQRKAPENKALANLVAFDKSGLSEGQMIKCFFLAHLRLGKYFGPQLVTEEEIMAQKDFDSVDLFSRHKPHNQTDSTKNEASMDETYVESEVTVSANGSMTLNDKAIIKQNLVSALKKLKTDAEAKGEKVLLTFIIPEVTNDMVHELQDAAYKAGINDVSFGKKTPDEMKQEH